MDISPLANAGPLIQSHIASALFALALGPVILLRKKGTPLHNRLGKLWVASMALTIFSAAFIYHLRMFFPENPMLGFYIVLTLFLVIFSAYWLGTSKSKATLGAKP